MLAFLAAATIYTFQIGLAALGVLDLVAATAADVAALAVLFLYARTRRRGPHAIGLRGAPLRFFVAALLIGGTAWYLDLRLVLWLQPPGDTGLLEGLVERTALVPTLLAIAVLPAFTEELIFRGVLARGLASWAPAPVAVVLSALAFSAYHVLPIQMVATFPLGLALGFLALRADSALPGMLAHAANNAIAIVISREQLPGVASWIGAHGTAALVIAAAGASAGLALAAPRRRT